MRIDKKFEFNVYKPAPASKIYADPHLILNCSNLKEEGVIAGKASLRTSFMVGSRGEIFLC
jgi:hypothetical protein